MKKNFRLIIFVIILILIITISILLCFNAFSNNKLSENKDSTSNIILDEKELNSKTTTKNSIIETTTKEQTSTKEINSQSTTKRVTYSKSTTTTQKNNTSKVDDNKTTKSITTTKQIQTTTTTTTTKITTIQPTTTQSCSKVFLQSWFRADFKTEAECVNMGERYKNPYGYACYSNYDKCGEKYYMLNLWLEPDDWIYYKDVDIPN